MSPGIVRPKPEGGYEIIAGHRRKRGSELAGRETMPVLIRELDDDEATIIMVDSNLQREKILPSEKAFAYKMKMEALKHQGKRRDLTSEPAVPKLTAREKIAQDRTDKIDNIFGLSLSSSTINSTAVCEYKTELDRILQGE